MLTLALVPLSVNKTSPLNEWSFVGGDCAFRRMKFKTLYPDKQIPEHVDECICGHKIKENCYIRNTITDNLIIIGDSCLQLFINNNGTTKTTNCISCGKKHNNRSDSWCNICRGGILKIGQYRGKSYRWVKENDPDYCSRLSYIDPFNSLHSFVRWLSINSTNNTNRKKNTNNEKHLGIDADLRETGNNDKDSGKYIRGEDLILNKHKILNTLQSGDGQKKNHTSGQNSDCAELNVTKRRRKLRRRRRGTKRHRRSIEETLRDKKQRTNDKGNETNDKKYETNVEKHETNVKKHETNDKKNETNDKKNETNDKNVVNYYIDYHINDGNDRTDGNLSIHSSLNEGDFKMGFGKYYDRTYNWVKCIDQRYCVWVLSTNDSCCQLNDFKCWLKRAYKTYV